jgi:hypothetical protein
MEPNREANNPWEAQRVNINRPQNLMYDIKKPTPTPSPLPPPLERFEGRKSSHKKLYVLSTLAILLLAIVGYTAFYFYQKANKVAEQVTIEPIDQLNQAVNEIGELVILPINDNPTLSIVVDPQEAKKNSLFALFKFFENTEAGDMWLSYSKTGKNILYRPTAKKIVNMMTFPPETISNTEATTTTITTATSTKTR